MAAERSAVRKVTVCERQARLLVRHRLAVTGQDAPGPAGVAEAADALLGLHSTDPVSVFVGARARVPGVTPADVESALYDERLVARVLGMRRTMFVEPVALVPTIQAACTRALAAGERRRSVRLLEEGGVADAARWFDRVTEDTLVALRARGVATAVELSEDVPELTTKIEVGQGKKWGGTIGVSTRVLFLLATEGRIVRGRPRGGWTSTQYRWAPMEDWLGVGVDHLPEEGARAELAGLWLARFGPATFDDLKWWTGWTVRQTRAALTRHDVVEVDLHGREGLALADDLEPPPRPEPRVVLLAALDSTVMGWKERGWYLGDHGAQLFDRNGNAGATVWWDGRIVGGWLQRPDGEMVVRLLTDVGAEVARAADEEAARLADWLGDVRFVPRFRTPLERELSA
jgi:Winged helix DNA-binding domain